MAQNAVVLRLGGHVGTGCIVPVNAAQSVHSSIQQDTRQASADAKSLHVPARDAAVKIQGFAGTVSVKIKAPQSGSTRGVKVAKGAMFGKEV